MSSLFLVRHGQASFMSDNYDQLSPLGETQARILGNHWAALGMRFDRVYVGPRQRHRQTHAAIAAVYQTQQLYLPSPEPLPELDEHQGVEVMEHVLPALAKRDPIIKASVGVSGMDGMADYQTNFKIFKRVMKLWTRDELEADGFQSWAAFKDQVQRGIKNIIAENSSGKTIVAFTSTGPIAVAMGYALNLADEQILDLSWAVWNAAYTEFKFSGKRFSLSTFNAASHLQKPELLTYV